MLFNSLTYLVFMAVAVALVAVAPYTVRRAVFLLGSLAFYAFWRVDFTFLVLFSALIDFLAAKYIHSSSDERVRKILLAISLTMNLGLLVVFKYTYFVVGSTQSVLTLFGIDWNPALPAIVLPLGISFYTFQTISYSIDVYRRTQQPVDDFFLFVTYVMFWPQLVAGPVLRAHEVLPQIRDHRRANFGEFVHGFEEFLQGMFKKVVLADGMGKIVDYGYGLPVDSLGTLYSWTLAFAFGLQIYFDFSGYSQIAIGSARMLGFRFPQNFNWPYLAVSPRDFWKRWHISLSAWIRDYLYLPLQGARFRGASTGGIEADAARVEISGLRKNAALFLTWFIMGLWHGADWKFAVWGVWHATLIFIYRQTHGWFARWPTFVRTVGGWTWTVSFAMLGWLFFRADTAAGAAGMLVRAFDPTRLTRLAMRENSYLIVFLEFAGLLVVAGALRLSGRLGDGLPSPLRHAALAVANTTMFFGVFLYLREVQQFIYFQF